MRVFRHLVAVTILVVALPTWAADPAPTAKGLVEGGVNAYLAGGAREALKFWLKGSALEGNPQALTQANNLTQIEDFYGKPVGFDVVKEQEAGPKARVIYFSINYEKGIAFGVFQVYRNPVGQWVATQFNFNTDALKVFPSCLFTQ
jgi:hypothetical protein